MTGRVKLGLYGGKGGSSKDITGSPTRLNSVTIRSTSEAIVSLGFSYVIDGQEYNAGQWGGTIGSSSKIDFPAGEYLTEINGTMGKAYNITNVITSLTFVTNKGTKYGPYGKEEGTSFSIIVTEGRVVGFFGRSGDLLDAIGVYIMP